MCPARSVIIWQKGMDYKKLIHDYYQIKSNINNFAKVLPWIGNINININLNFLLHFRLAQHIHNMIGLKQLELTSSPLPPPSTFISTNLQSHNTYQGIKNNFTFSP